MKRIGWIDRLKGIGILLVVFQHCIGTNLIGKVVLSFHMPLFFFASGLIAHTKPKRPFLSFLTGRIRKFFIPQLFLGVLFFLIVDVFITAKEPTIELFFYEIWRWWFLEVLFLVEILFYVISRCISLNRISCMAILIIDIALIVISISFFSNYQETPFYPYIVPIAFLFYFAGFALKNVYNVPFEMCKLNPRVKGFAVFVLILALLVLAFKNDTIIMYANYYGFFPGFVITSTVGIIICIYFSQIIECKELLYCGQNSLIIYVLQFLIITPSITVLAPKLLMIASFIPYEMINIVSFIITLLLLIPMTWFCKKYLKIIFG